MASVALVGSTGLVGSHILSTLTGLPSVGTIHAYSRRELKATADTKVKGITSSDTSAWPTQYPSGAEVFYSALGTTRGNAGGLEAQRKIDYDLNLDLAKAAKAAGTKAYVLISSSGSSASSPFPYPKMKGELEEAVKALDFDHTVILRPGLIVGDRKETRLAEGAFRKLAWAMGSVSGGHLKDFWAQDADVIAKAAVRAGLDCLEGKQKAKVVMLSQADIVRLGRTEWKQ